ncbi:MAG TPA: AAA family ATPase, partial [Methanocorpusculum sp.]|nr:AAA family ATPase [Methanocorpusculum sp.]
MHIVQVDIDNFKSFSRKTKIPFYEGFTVVSGPNGSGKSNIIDSILFVLSLSTSRNLRAEKLTDFINNKSGKNTAEVTLTFSDDTKIRRR